MHGADPLPFVFGLPLMVWFAFLAYLHLRAPERVWAANRRWLERKGRPAPEAAPSDFLLRTKRRGTAYAMLVVLTAIGFAYLAFDFHRLSRSIHHGS